MARNRAEASGSICHSHDFCDANMVMEAAFTEAMGRAPDVGGDTKASNRDVRLWNEAWTIAKDADFNMVRANEGGTTMPRPMTEHAATWIVVSWVINPANNYNWWEARNTAAHRRDFQEAVANDIPEAAAKADWRAVMRMLAAASKAFYR